MKKLGVGLLVLLAALGVFIGAQSLQKNPEDYANRYETNHAAGSALGNIEATTLAGGAYSFKSDGITVVNLWGTFCGPCIEEMPTLEKVHQAYKDQNVRFVGIITDGDGESEQVEVKRIIEETGATFEQVRPNPALEDALLSKFDYVPVTLVLDQDGAVLESFVPGGGHEKTFKELIEQAKEEVSNGK